MALYQSTLALSRNERLRAMALPPGADRDDAKGWARDLLVYARLLRRRA